MMGERSLLVVAILSYFPHWRGGRAMPVGGSSACSSHEPDAKGQPVGPSSVQRPISAIYRKDETWVSGDMPESQGWDLRQRKGTWSRPSDLSLARRDKTPGFHAPPACTSPLS